MADDVAKLAVLIEANTKSYERAMVRIGQVTEKAMKAAGSTSARSQRSMANMTRGIESARFETANLAAQFQDIAVQLQGGGNPFTVALQQGTQIGAALGNQGAAGAVKTLGGAFASLISPVNLAVIGIIAAGGYAATYFADLMRGGDGAKRSLEDQEKLIAKVADRWGDAVPALRQYMDELERQRDRQMLDEAVQDRLAQIYKSTSDLMPTLAAGMADVALQAQEIGASRERVDTLLAAFNDLTKKSKENKVTLDDLRSMQDALAQLMANDGVSAAADLRDEIESLSGAYAKAAEQAQILREQAASAAYVSMDDAVRAEQERMRKIMTPSSVTTRKDRHPEEYKTTRDAAGESIKREQQAITDLIADMEDELRLVGATSLEREKANALRRLGASATQEQIDQVGRLVEQIHAEQAALEAAAEAQRAMEEAQSYFARSALDSFTAVIEGSKTAEEAFVDLAKQIANAALQAALLGQGPLSGMFGTTSSSGGILGAIIGGLMGRAGGGHVQAGRGYMVGERGPEMFVPQTAGRIVANQNLPGMGGNSTVIHIDARGAQKGVAEEIRREMNAAISQSERRQGNPNIVGSRMRAARRYGAA